MNPFLSNYRVIFLTTAISLAALCAPSAAYSSPSTAQCIAGHLEPIARDESGVRYVRGDPDHPISFGLEIEASTRENPNIVNDYRPYNIPERLWVAKPLEERVQIARALEDQYTHVSDQVLFFRLTTASDELPEQLASEGDGNFEFNGYVFDTFEALEERVNDFVERYGRASMQVHVAYPQIAMPGTAGYVVFESDAAQFETFERNYARYLEDSSVTPAKNLVHHSLGPLGQDDVDRYVSYEERAASGKRIGNPGTSRIVNGPVFRGDTYPKGIVGHEIRQYHKRYQDMLASADRLSREMASENGLSRYAPFAENGSIQGGLPKVRATELEIAIEPGKWRGYFAKIGALIQSSFPNLTYGGAPLGQRFFFPFRDWVNYPLVVSLPDAERLATQDAIRKATAEYLRAVNTLVQSGKADQDVLQQIQILNAKWGSETGLNPLFEKFRGEFTDGIETARAPPSPLLTEIPGMAPKPGEFSDGSPYIELTLNKDSITDPKYRELLENSVEVIGTQSHISLRVGARIYSFNGVGSASAAHFSPAFLGGNNGILFMMPKDEIAQVQGQVEKFYQNSNNFNVPAYDGYSPYLEVVREPDGGFRYSSSTTGSKHNYLANNQRLNAEIVHQGKRAFLKTPGGWMYRIKRRGNHYYAQSYSCSTATTCMLNSKLGISVEFWHGARSLMEDLLAGNLDGTPPDAVIHYP